MTHNVTINPHAYQKPAYFGLLLVSLIHVVFLDYAMAASTMALSIVFYPFDTQTPWPDKSKSQKIAILSHLLFALILILFALSVYVE